MLLITTNGGLDRYFANIPELVLPQDIDRLNEISQHYGYSFLPRAEPTAA